MSIEVILTAKSKDLGGGFIVRRALPMVERRMIGPFVFFDHMGPVELEINHGMDVRPHPHIGLSTLTYLFEGEIVHRDTLGLEQVIQPGAVNWMTAGSGIAHSERSAQEARSRVQHLHGIQTWLALPKNKEEVDPSFHHHNQKNIPEISEQGAVVRVIAGEYEKQKSPVQVYSETTYLHLELKEKSKFEFAPNGHELGVYVVHGLVRVDGMEISEGQLAAVQVGSAIRMEALKKSRVLILGGAPLDGPRHIWWNFVSSSKERIEKAKQDWTNQAFGKIRGETEFIPLPST